MTHVSIIVPQGCALLNSITRLFKIFDWVNCLAVKNGRTPLFDVHLVGTSNRVDLYGGQSALQPDLTLENAAGTDLVIIPALAGDIAEGLKINAVFTPWIIEQYTAGAEIASLCTGVFLAASTGLIGDGKCATQWFVAAEFRKTFSQINLATEKIVIAEEGIHSRGGAYSYMNLLIAKFAGRQAAIACSEIFGMEFNQECQSVVTMCAGQNARLTAIQKRSRRFTRNEFTEEITEKQFAERFTLTKTNHSNHLEIETAHHSGACIQTAQEPAVTTRNHTRKNESVQAVNSNNIKTFRNIFNGVKGIQPNDEKVRIV